MATDIQAMEKASLASLKKIASSKGKMKGFFCGLFKAKKGDVAATVTVTLSKTDPTGAKAGRTGLGLKKELKPGGIARGAVDFDRDSNSLVLLLDVGKTKGIKPAAMKKQWKKAMEARGGESATLARFLHKAKIVGMDPEGEEEDLDAGEALSSDDLALTPEEQADLDELLQDAEDTATQLDRIRDAFRDQGAALILADIRRELAADPDNAALQQELADVLSSGPDPFDEDHADELRTLLDTVLTQKDPDDTVTLSTTGGTSVSGPPSPKAPTIDLELTSEDGISIKGPPSPTAPVIKVELSTEDGVSIKGPPSPKAPTIKVELSTGDGMKVSGPPSPKAPVIDTQLSTEDGVTVKGPPSPKAPTIEVELTSEDGVKVSGPPVPKAPIVDVELTSEDGISVQGPPSPTAPVIKVELSTEDGVSVKGPPSPKAPTIKVELTSEDGISVKGPPSPKAPVIGVELSTEDGVVVKGPPSPKAPTVKIELSTEDGISVQGPPSPEAPTIKVELSTESGVKVSGPFVPKAPTIKVEHAAV